MLRSRRQRTIPRGYGRADRSAGQAATEQLAQAAVTPFLKAAFRRRILEIRQQNEQTIDRHTIDEVLYAGFDATAVEKAQTKVKDFRAWIGDHKDEMTALQVLYAGARPIKVSLKDLRQLKDALARPPLAASPAQLWRAFQAVEADKVKGSGGGQLADLVNLVRHALIPALTLVPYRDELLERYQVWLQNATLIRLSRPNNESGWTAWLSTSLPASPLNRRTSRMAGLGSTAAWAALMRCSVTNSSRSWRNLMKSWRHE